MLFYTDEVIEQLEKLANEPTDASQHEQLAEKLLKIDPDNGVARIMMAATAEAAGDMDGAERLAWEALDRMPNDYQSYLTLSRILGQRDQETLGQRMFHLAIWKTALGEDVDPVLADLCGSVFGVDKRRDDPETYYRLAAAADEHIKHERVPQEVEERLLPYRLLNNLQKQADERVKSSTIKEIIKASAVCAPVLYSSLRQLARDGEDLEEPFPLLLIALLGEIAGPEMVGEILELADHGKAICVHTMWAIWRLGQRHPEEVLRILREAGAAAPSLRRGRIAEHLTYLPKLEGVTEALVALLAGFEARERDQDAEVLLALVVDGLIERGEESLGRKLLAANTPQLSKTGRSWIKEVFKDGERFTNILQTEGVTENDIADICVGRVYLGDQEDEDDDLEDDDIFDDPDFDEPPPPPPMPKIGRNEPCWCGSGKKYKKCHLASDEGERVQ